VRALAREETPIVGFGVETVGTDAGGAALRPAVPGPQLPARRRQVRLTQLANLAELPPTGAVLVVAPLKLVDGTGSPCRVLALVPRGAG
jgi:kynurenine formamidase